MTVRLGALLWICAAAPSAWALPSGDGPDAVPAPAPAPPSPEPPATITVSGACPSAEAIWSAVQSLVAAKDLDKLSTASKVAVSDLGDTYRVAVTAQGIDRLRVYRDLGRDCVHRARFAAVFVVLTLMPPDVLLDALPAPPEPPPPPPPSPPPPTVAPPSPPARPRRLRLELVALGELAPALGSAPETTALGGELRAVARLKTTLALTLAAGYAPRVRFDLGGLTASEWRLPFDAGLRLALVTARALELSGELGLGGALFHAAGTDTVDPQSGTRLDLGARAGFVLRLGRPAARLAPVVGVHAELFPKPYDITVTPQGMLGRTPALWLGATAGIAVTP
jgi:hypothetical protein